MNSNKLTDPFRKFFNRMMETFAQYQWESLLRSHFLATPDERKARLRAVMELSIEVEKIKAVSIYRTKFHEQIIEEIIMGDWKKAAELNGYLGEPDMAENEHLTNLWEGFRAIVIAFCAEAAKRAAGQMTEPD